MYYLSVFNKEKELEHFKVPEEVYIYVKQLEACINYPELSKLKELYDFRFRSCG